MIMVNEITRSLDNGEHVVGLFLDFSKAFDTVNHTVLLKKLYHYGIKGNALECQRRIILYSPENPIQ